VKPNPHPGYLQRLYSPDTRIRVCITDTSHAAQVLRDRHLSGPAAGHLLAEAIVGVAILSEDASCDEECVVLRAQVDGPLKGFLVEATGTGGLRGYTNTKVINEVDEADHQDPQAVLGMGADIQIIRSLPTRILDQAQHRVVPPSVQVAVAKYFNQSVQIPTAIEILVESDKEATQRAVGVCAQRMPDSDQEAFIRALEAFHDGSVRRTMKTSLTPEAIAEAVGIPDLAVTATRAMTFDCRCSRARVISSLHALSLEDRMDMLSSKTAHHIVCHLCGEDYVIANSDIPPPV
jgi:molecular chaperone Hsp33